MPKRSKECSSRLLLIVLSLLRSELATPVSSSSWGGNVNVLLLLSDSMDGRVLDPGSPIASKVHTPAFDELARNGVNFANAYAASPQCVPSRTTLLSGRRTDQTRTFSNGKGFAAAPSGELDALCVKSWDEETCEAWSREQNLTSTLLHSLRDAALYEVQVFGKTDVGGNVNRDFGPYGASDGFHGGPSLPILTRSADIRKPTKPRPTNITDEHDDDVHPEDWETIHRCIEWLRARGDGRGRTNAPRNWVLYCSLNIPHPPFNTNSSWISKYVNVSAVDVPEWPPGGAPEAHPYDSYMSASKHVGGNFSDTEIKNIRTTYYAMVGETDYMLGSVIQACKDANLYNNTVIVFLSDHGEMNMEHRQVWKNAMYEASVRVPLIVSAGEAAGEKLRLRRGVVVNDVVSLLDVYPTLMAVAGAVDPKADLSGYSLAPYLSSDAMPNEHPDYIVSQYFSNMGNTGVFMIRWERWKYVAFGTSLSAFSKGYVDQLFDLEQDPDELMNVADENPDIVAKLDAKLQAELASGSNVVSTSGSYLEIDRYVKTQQQQLYRKYFLEEEHAEVQWRRLEVCVERPPKYAEDPEKEAPCLASDGNLTLPEGDEASVPARKLRKLFEQAYHGFDDADWARVQRWIAETP